MSTTSESRGLLESLNLNSSVNYGSVEPNSTSRHLTPILKQSKRPALEIATKSLKIVDIPFLKGILAGLKGENCSGLTTPFNTPVRFGDSPISAAKKPPRPYNSQRSTSNWTNESGCLASSSLPGRSLAPPAVTSLDPPAETSSEEEGEGERASPDHEEFFTHLEGEVCYLLDYAGTRIAALKCEVERVSRGEPPNPDVVAAVVLSDSDVSSGGASSGGGGGSGGSVEDMFESGAPGNLLHRGRLLRRALQRLSDALSVNMSHLYRLCCDYDRSFGGKRAEHYFSSQQPRVASCTEAVCDLVFVLDEKIARADATPLSDGESGGDDDDGAEEEKGNGERGGGFFAPSGRRGGGRREGFLACLRSLPTLLHLVMFVSTLVVLTVLMDRGPTTIGFYRLFRGPAIIILFLYMISLNIVVWRLNGIRYHRMLGCSSALIEFGVFPTARQLADYAGAFAVAFAAFASAFMICFGFGIVEASLDKIFPCLMWAIVLAFFLNPTKFFHRQGRWGLAKSLFRIATAPFHRVVFGDFWLADQLNSLVIVLLDIEYLVCYCSVDWSQPPTGKSCGSLVNLYIRAILSVLPAWFRFMQCLRDFYDSRGSLPHFLNAIKYSSTFLVVAAATLYSAHYPSGYPDTTWDAQGLTYLVLWSVASWIRALYTFAWDINRDWGLVRILRSRRHFCLREDLIYHPAAWYYAVMVVDFVLRISQTLKISLGVFLHRQSDLLFTSLIVLEVFRRFLWNFFRLEWHQVVENNKHKHSPTRLVESASFTGSNVNNVINNNVISNSVSNNNVNNINNFSNNNVDNNVKKKNIKGLR